MTIEELARRLAAVAASVGFEARRALEYGAIAIEQQAKRDIGRHHPTLGPLLRWPKLKPATLPDRRRLDYAPPDNPLLGTGDLRNGVTHSVSRLGQKIEAWVGTDGVVAVAQEHGGGAPASSFLKRVAKRKEDRIGREVSAAIGSALRLR